MLVVGVARVGCGESALWSASRSTLRAKYGEGMRENELRGRGELVSRNGLSELPPGTIWRPDAEVPKTRLSGW